MSRLITVLLAAVLLGRLASAEAISPAEIAAVKAAEVSRVQAIDSVYGAVVAIYGNDRQGGGSGVLFDESGYALTNHHVVAAAGVKGWAGLADGKLYRWRLIGTDPGGDVAIIQLQGQEKFPTAPLGDSSKVRVGDFAMAMGNPFVLAEDQRPTVTLGIVSGVERFQPGSDLNQLVYGNCIQVDSSINPGNSGGPLFNIRGQIIGINGRGSFEERGRVNVGLGYAISANQCVNFVPELLATKIAQHGTLDAVFGTREGKVICHTLNLDASIARLGLQLGDELLAFEGHKIHNANQFTNLLSMLPAGWPCELTFTRAGGDPKTVHVRLTALPYENSRPAVPEEDKKPGDKEEQKPAQEPKQEDKPEKKNPEEKPSTGGEEKKPQPERKAEEKPSDAPMPLPRERLQPRPPAIPLHDAGAIRDAKLNGEIAQWALQRWRTASKLNQPAEAAAIRMLDELRASDERIGVLESHLATDGRCAVNYELAGRNVRIGYDGKTFWQTADAKTQSISQAKALRNPYFWQAFALAQCLRSDPFARLGTLKLDGSDKAASKAAFRLNLTDESTEEAYLWLSIFGSEGRPMIRLIKSGVALDDDDPIPSVRFQDWQTVADRELPRTRELVIGLGETVRQTFVNQSCEVLKDVANDIFGMPE